MVNSFYRKNLKTRCREELKIFLNENNFLQQWEPFEDHTDILFIKNN